MEALRVSLETYNVEVLKAMADHLDLVPKGKSPRKAWLVEKLARAIVRRAGDEAVVASLSRAQRGLLALVLEAGGQAERGALAPPMMLSSLVRLPQGQGEEGVLPSLEEVLHSLLLKGLLVNLTEPPGYSTRRTLDPVHKVGVPPEVIQALPRELLILPRPDLDEQEMEEPPHVRHGSVEEFVRQLFFAWAELRRQPGRALKAGGIYKRDLRRVSESIGLDLEEHEERARHIIDLLIAAGLLREGEKYISAVEDEKARRFWRRDLAEQLKIILDTLTVMQHEELELDLTPLSEVRMGYQVSRTFYPFDMYRKLLELLKELVHIQWFPFPAFVSLLNRGVPGSFVLPQSVLQNLYKQLSWYSWGGSKEDRRANLESGLRKVDRGVALQVLERLLELGVVMLGYEEGQGRKPSALRLSDVAKAALDGTDGQTGEGRGQVILQPDFQLLALGPVGLSTLATLERIAAREKVETAAVSYRLTRESVYAALQEGETVKSLLAFLEEVTHLPVPQNVTRTLREWGMQHQRIVVRPRGMVVQVDAPEILERVLEEPRLRDRLVRLDERAAWVPSEEAERVQRRLRSLELLPAVSRGPEADLPDSLRWDDGLLWPRKGLPSIYVTGTLRRFAEEEEGAWRLTQCSVRSAVNAGLEVPDLIERLEAMAGHALPEEWQKRLRVWGAHYGNARAAEVHLLRFESAESLEELREVDRRLRRWLKPLNGAAQLAVVEDKRWEAVVAALEEWGVPIEEGRFW